MKSVAYEPGSELSGLIAERTALAAEVERLAADNAALRAQLDAGEEWRAIRDEPPLGEWVQVRGRGQLVSSAWTCELNEWRPAPPQE